MILSLSFSLLAFFSLSLSIYLSISGFKLRKATYIHYQYAKLSHAGEQKKKFLIEKVLRSSSLGVMVITRCFPHPSEKTESREGKRKKVNFVFEKRNPPFFYKRISHLQKLSFCRIFQCRGEKMFFIYGKIFCFRVYLICQWISPGQEKVME